MEPKRPSDPDYLGKWKITSRLGEGGFGIVYLASSGVHSAAIKVIKEEFLEDQGAREKIIHEAQVLGKLDDPNIGKIVDSGLNEPVPWLATEYVNGPTLQEKVLLEKPLEELAWFNLASDLFHALTTSHAAGVIHKDIKPSNIILGESGTKLIDFGISHLSGKTKLGTVGDFEGTHPFSAPENYITGKNVPQMDVFSAAATLAFAAKGSSVWAGESLRQIMGSIMYAEPNLDGMTDLQKDFLLPLFAKDASVRPSAREALDKTNEYLEYLVADAEGAKPKPIQVRAMASRGRKRAIVASFGFISAFALTALIFFVNSHGQSPIKSGAVASVNTSTKVTQATTQVNIFPSPTTKVSSPTPQTNTSGTCEEFFQAHSDRALTACVAPAAAGDARSNYYLGKIYQEDGNNLLAEKYFLRAVKLYSDDTDSMGGLVQIYIDTKDTKSYAIWVKRCANYMIKTTSGARCKLLYGLDQLQAQNEKVGIAYLMDSYDWGNPSAATTLGIHYREQGNVDKAITWFTHAAEAGDSTGLSELLTTAYNNNRISLWKEWLIKSAEQGNAANMGKIALYAAIAEKDYVTSKNWGLKGATAGDVNAMFALGYTYYISDRNYVLAKPWLLKAADKGVVLAMRTLGDVYRMEKNYSDSIIWYKKGSTNGDLTSTYWTAVVYAGGLFDITQACTYFGSTVKQAGNLKTSGTLTADEQKLLDSANTSLATTCAQ